jgi:hypothetical protein
MARISHTNTEKSTSSNPTSKYLEWKSNDKAFSFYDKEAGQGVMVELPFKFLFLQHYSTIKGWHTPSSSKIYSNEIFFMSEELRVRSFGNKKENLPAVEIVSGQYKKIKPEIINAGGKYHKSIYVMLEDGSVANISLKGSAVSQWSDFISINEDECKNKWIEVNSADEKKKGSIKYSTPNFTVGQNLSKADSSIADAVDKRLTAYMESYFNKDNAPQEEEEPMLDF